MGAKVPVVLIDNRSALNVYHFKTALTIGLDVETIIPSPLTIRAYDNTSRKSMRTFKAHRKIGPMDTIMEFHVMDITPNYRKGMASSYWGYSLFSTPKDEDPMEGGDCHSTW